LRTLDLYNNDLTSVPAEIVNLSVLTDLHLRGNQLTSVPVELGRLAALQSLNLHNNDLTSIPAELGRAVHVDSFQTSMESAYGFSASKYNDINCIQLLFSNQLVPLQLGNLTTLQTLDLTNSQLTSVPVELGRLNINLVTLDLGGKGLHAFTSNSI
jgi:Leucine-rich repeat (LRR) protein